MPPAIASTYIGPNTLQTNNIAGESQLQLLPNPAPSNITITSIEILFTPKVQVPTTLELRVYSLDPSGVYMMVSKQALSPNASFVPSLTSVSQPFVVAAGNYIGFATTAGTLPVSDTANGTFGFLSTTLAPLTVGSVVQLNMNSFSPSWRVSYTVIQPINQIQSTNSGGGFTGLPFILVVSVVPGVLFLVILVVIIVVVFRKRRVNSRQEKRVLGDGRITGVANGLDLSQPVYSSKTTHVTSYTSGNTTGQMTTSNSSRSDEIKLLNSSPKLPESSPPIDVLPLETSSVNPRETRGTFAWPPKKSMTFHNGLEGILCQRCDEQDATTKCADCNNACFCATCADDLHSTGPWKTHKLKMMYQPD